MQLNADLDAGRDGSPVCLLHALLHVHLDQNPLLLNAGEQIVLDRTNHFLLLSGLTTPLSV